MQTPFKFKKIFIAILASILTFLVVWTPIFADGPCDVFAPGYPTPIMWQTADGLSLPTGTLVSTWDDESGNGNHLTQSDPSYQASYGMDANDLPSVYFSSDRYEWPLSYFYTDNSYTVLAASGNVEESEPLYGEADTVDNVGVIWFSGNQARWGDADNDPNITYDHDPPGGISISTFNRNGDLALFTTNYLSPTWESGLNNWDDPNNTKWLGASQRQAGYSYISGYIYEIIVFETVLSEGDREAWIDYLYNKWTLAPDQCDYNAICPTVPDYHFTNVITDAWMLSGSAAISDSVLTLPAGDAAGQNLTLSSNTAYNAVISVTEVITDPVNLTLVLGTDTQTMTITGTGYYSASFTTQNLGGTLGYVLQNDSITDTIKLDYTCLIRADGAEETICLAPPNGEFETATGWGWFRGAAWQNPAKNAFLPYPEVGLIQPTNTFTLPSLATGEYLILGFDAHSEQNNAVIGGQVLAGGSDATFYYETFPVDYRFETDLSLLAGGSDASLALVNASLYAEEALSETVGLDDIIVDNVCVFISDDPPDLPTPIEDSGAWSVNFGFNYTTCSDIDGIWAYFGVNMAQYRSDYYAGATVWDPVGWVPWLISAFWVIIGSLGCMLLSIYLGLLHTLEYFLNNFLNYAFWFYLSTLGFIAWLGDWLNWGWLSLWNIIQIYFSWLGDALLWLWESLSNVSNWWYLTFGGFALWLALWLLNLNGVRVILNLLIAAWNLFISGIGGTIGGIIQTGVDLWNNYIAPFLGSFSLLGLILGLLVTLATVGFGWVWTVLQWFWANVISLGTVPLSFYYAFDDGLNSSAYDALVECAGVNFWCAFLAGVQLINQIIAHSILYPIVITGIILSTIVILWLNIKELFSIDLNIR